MNLKTLTRQVLATAATITAFARSASAQVAIPTIGGAFENENDLITTSRTLVTQFLEIALILVGVVIFVIVGWAVVRKFYECVSGRAEWGEAGVTIGAGVAAIVVAGLLLSIGNGVLPTGTVPAPPGP